jgi:axial budding pattern protein 2
MSPRVIESRGKVLHLLFLLVSYTVASPAITFPINSQVPPVLRVGEPFSWTFSASTFSSGSSLNYTLSNAPSWLQLDSTSRTLSGVAPGSAANTAPVIRIISCDNDGCTTMGSTLVITDHPGPTIAIPLESQLKNLAGYSPPSSILYSPSTSFNIRLDPGTFGGNAAYHYAISGDNTPLPSWITFDQATLAFSGQTLDSGSLLSPPQTWDFNLIASNVAGFGEASLPFSVVVANHKLEFKNGTVDILASIGKPIDITDLSSSLILDGGAVNSTQIVKVDDNLPSWLSLDKTRLTINGTPPKGTKSDNFSLSITDIYQDVANLTLNLFIQDKIFTETTGSFNITSGAQFTHNFTSSFSNSTDVVVTGLAVPDVSWLLFSNKTLVLSGTVPLDPKLTQIRFALNATSISTGLSDNATYTANILPASATSGVVKPVSPDPSASANTQNGFNPAYIAAIIVPIIVGIAGLVACFICSKRRRSRARKRSWTPEKTDISRPIPTPSLSDQQTVHRRSPRSASSRSRESVAASPTHRPMTMQSRSYTTLSLDGGAPRNSRRPGYLGSVRSHSDGDLEHTASSNRYAEDGTAPHGRNSMMPMSRNFSWKTTWPVLPEDPMPPAVPPNITEESRETAVSRASPSVNVYSHVRKRSVSQSTTNNYLGPLITGHRLSGVSHDSQTPSLSSASGSNWYTIGDGQISQNSIHEIDEESTRANNPSSWLTVQGHGDNNGQQRHSATSALTENTELLNSPTRATMWPVPKSDSQPSLPESEHPSNANVRRLGSSPFFASSMRSTSQRNPFLARIRGERSSPYATSPADHGPPSNSDAQRGVPQGVPVDDEELMDPQLLPAPLRSSPRWNGQYPQPTESTRQLDDYVSKFTGHLSHSSNYSLRMGESPGRMGSVASSPRLPSHKAKISGEEENYFGSKLRPASLSTGTLTDEEIESVLYSDGPVFL